MIQSRVAFQSLKNVSTPYISISLLFNTFFSSADAIYSIASTESVVTKSISIQSFTLEYIETAIERYKTQIGEGGFGAVYRGTLPDGQEVAVKVRSATSTQGTREFNNEVSFILLSETIGKRLLFGTLKLR